MRKQHDIYRYIWRLWQGFHRNETNSAQQINYSTCKSQELKFSHPHQLQEQKKLQFCHPFFPYCKKQEQFFPLWWSKASTRRWSLLPLRFVVSPHMYPLEIPEWNQDELRSKNIFFNSNFHLPTENKTKSIHVLERRQVAGFRLITVRKWRKKKYSLLFTMVLDGKRLSG